MNYDSFSHGQIKSKLWLAEKIEPFIKKNTLVLGSWYNLTAFILKTRGYTGNITGIDIDPKVKEIADKICNLWILEGSVFNYTEDAANVSYDYDTIINCSSEHMSCNWFTNVRADSLVCIQSTNVIDDSDPWYIANPSPTINSFAEKYNLSTTLFLDTLRIQYDTWGYDRYMLIGYK